MTYTYEIPLLIDLGKAIPEVGEITESVNAHLTTMCDSCRLIVTAEIGSLVFESPRHLTDKELAMLKSEARQCASECKSRNDVLIGEPRCKSQKSSSQSESR